jgi:CheY-like chemotaxis protein
MQEINCSFPEKKVLIAEDDELSREIIHQMLNLCAISPDVAKDGDEVMAWIEKKEYDLLILDIHMPKKNGLEVAKIIRKMGVKQPVILALTASVLPTEVSEIKYAGFDDYVRKPLEFNELKKVLLKYFSIITPQASS